MNMARGELWPQMTSNDLIKASWTDCTYQISTFVEAHWHRNFPLKDDLYLRKSLNIFYCCHVWECVSKNRNWDKNHILFRYVYFFVKLISRKNNREIIFTQNLCEIDFTEKNHTWWSYIQNWLPLDPWQGYSITSVPA